MNTSSSEPDVKELLAIALDTPGPPATISIARAVQPNIGICQGWTPALQCGRDAVRAPECLMLVRATRRA